MTKKTHPGPAETLRDGFIKCTIWKNEGEKGPYFTATFAKSYEKDGAWHDGQSFSSTDLLGVSELARNAYAAILERRAALKEELDANHELDANPEP